MFDQTFLFRISLIPTEIPEYRKTHIIAQGYSDMIWPLWSREYLSQLITRSKWNVYQYRKINVGELVWLIDDDFVKRYNAIKLTRFIDTFSATDFFEQKKSKHQRAFTKCPLLNWHCCTTPSEISGIYRMKYQF